MQNLQPSHKKGIALSRSIEAYILSKKKVTTFLFGGKRPIYLDKYLLAQYGRRDKSKRLSLFFAGIELMRTARKEDVTRHSETEWEITGKLMNNKNLAVHIREEKIRGDKILFLISTFEKQ